MAMDAEYTITSPIPISSTAAQTSVSSNSRGAACRPHAMIAVGAHTRRRQLAVTASDEHLGAVLVVAEHVEARARRRQQHRVALARLLERQPHRVVHVPARSSRHAAAFHRLRDLLAIASDQHHGARTGRHGRLSGEKSWPLPSPPAISTHAAAIPVSAATVAPTLVPLESS